MIFFHLLSRQFKYCVDVIEPRQFLWDGLYFYKMVSRTDIVIDFIETSRTNFLWS